MSAHTPGPWMWDRDVIKNDPFGRVRYRVVARGKTVTQCYHSSSDGMAENDARLISASPDLLEAAKDAAAVLSDLPSTNQKGTRTRGAWSALISAIAKAEGRS